MDSPSISPKNGRPPRAESVRAKAARCAREAVLALADVASNSNAPADARVEAAKTLLAFATNKAPS